MSDLTQLPFDILHLIQALLGPDDVCALGRTCRGLYELLRDPSVGRGQIGNAVPYSDEAARAQQSGDYDRLLRAFVKRQQAIAGLEPFAVATVAWCDMHIYTNQTLVYTRDRTLYLLTLAPDTTVRHAINVDVRALLDVAVPESHGMRRYTFRPLYYAEGIVSCVYAHHRLGPGTANAQENWLVCFAPATGWHMSCRLPFPHHRVFVRNSSKYLVYGMYTARAQIAQDPGGGLFAPHPEDGGVDNHRFWRIRCFNLATQTWMTASSWQLDECLGLGEFGRDCCFEIIDDKFYAVSSQQRFLDMQHEMDYESRPHPDDYYLEDDDDDDDSNNNNNNNNDNDNNDDNADTDYYISDDDDDTFHPSDLADMPTEMPSDAGLLATGPGSAGVSSGRQTRRNSSSSHHSNHSNHSSHSNRSNHSNSSGGGGQGQWFPPAKTRASLFKGTSHFTIQRFSLDNINNVQGQPVFEQPTLKSRWRRRNSESTLDDRWATLKLQKSAETGDIVLIESRKEWLHGSSSSRRNYYVQRLVWPSDLRQRARERRLQQRRQAGAQGERQGEPVQFSYLGETAQVCSGVTTTTQRTTSPPNTRKRKPRLSDLEPSRRLPSAVHPGDNASVTDPLTLSQCPGRFYAWDASTFIDLVDQGANVGAPTQKLILRAGSRTLRHDSNEPNPDPNPAVQRAQPNANDADADIVDDPLYPIKEINRTYTTHDVRTWPRPMPDATAADMDTLNALLNPPECNGAVTAAWDDRLLVYSTRATNIQAGRPPLQQQKKTNKLKPLHAIVVVSFDPTLRLPGLKVWDQRHRPQQSSEGGEGGVGTGGEAAMASATHAALHESLNKAAAATLPAWASTAEPEYVAINNGYDFSAHWTS